MIAVVMVLVIAAISLILVRISNHHRKIKTQKMMHHFSQLGTSNALAFTSQEILQDVVIGLDGINRKLLILHNQHESFEWKVVDLAQVHNCSVKKVYLTSGPAHAREAHLDRLVLAIELKQGGGIMEVPFFTHSKNHIYQLAEMEQKAKYWVAVLSKLNTKDLNPV